MFNIPVKEIIVNDDSQVQLLEDDGTAYADNDIVADTSGGFILQGFLNEVIWAGSAAVSSTLRGGKQSYLRFVTGTDAMMKTTQSAGAAEIAGWTVTAASGAKKGDTYRLVLDSLDLTPTEFQNRPVEKRYMLGVDCADAAAVIAELVAQINADTNAPVTAYAGQVADAAKICLVGKSAYVGVKFDLFVGSYANVDQTTYTVSLAKVANATLIDIAAGDQTTQAAALPVNTYAALKNINWAKNFHIDRDINWMPLPGATYTSYYFEVVSPQIQTQAGSEPVPNQLQNAQVYGVRLWVNNLSAPTLLAAMNFLEGDVG
jgi:hypothetical protein